MAVESVSFRISRNTEDLAQTIHALSVRLVKLEQRLQAMQLQVDQWMEHSQVQEPEQLDCLDNVERLLHDCRCLLSVEEISAMQTSPIPLSEGDQQQAA